MFNVIYRHSKEITNNTDIHAGQRSRQKERKDMYIIRDREGGNTMDEFETYEEAKNKLNEWEAEDKAHGEYAPDFYEIYEEAR